MSRPTSAERQAMRERHQVVGNKLRTLDLRSCKCLRSLPCEVATLLDALDEAEQEVARLKRENREYVLAAPGLRWGEPCIGGTRLPCEQFALLWWQGEWTLERMQESWPYLSRGGLLVACWYQARHGTRAWRRRWKAWADLWAGELWESEWDKVELPPQVQAAGEGEE